MTTFEQLGAFIAQPAAPSRHLRDNLALHIVDTVGAWMASLSTPEGDALLRWRDASGEGAAPASMHRLRLDVATHCALARLSEIDDIHLASTTTPGAIVVPAAVIIAATCRNRDPDMLAAAIAAGYEVMVRFGQAIDGPSILYRGIWPTYFAAPLTVAAVAARLLGLDGRQCAHALALALTRSAPGVGHHGAVTTSRWLAIGQAAAAGLTAALAARAGFTSDLGLLNGGYLPGIFDVRPNMAVLTDGLGAQFRSSEVAFKPWCAARQTMAATQALIEIIGAGVVPDTIMQATAFVPPPHHRMIDHGVRAGDRASFLTSLPYHMARAAVAPDAPHDLGQPASMQADILAFMERITVAPDETLLAHFPSQWRARVEAQTPSGRHQRTVTDVPGDPARPFDAKAVSEKFRRFTASVVGAETAEPLLNHALGLIRGEADAAGLLQHIEKAARMRQRAPE